ncbi:MAG: thiol:disulfide interchange protein DsbA/DsbL [Proteobacteria bacterium]|nr:thiol:disulfide interchange protein DsbA/DsbL [Pseudomonadota bacterium]
MSPIRTFVRPALLTTALLLAACNQGQQAASQASSQAAPATTATTSASTASTAASGPSADAASASSTAAASPAATSSASDADAASRPAPPAGFPAGPTPVEGTDYTVIDTPDQPSGDKVQVVEVFGYGCPHCNNLQPSMTAWEAKLPRDVDFSYLPAAFGPGAPHCWEEFARGFYAAKAMGLPVSKFHDGVFKAVWDDKKFDGTTCNVIPGIFATFGVDATTFASTMQSFAVNAKIGNAHDQAMRWGVDSTPTIVVDGKYKVIELAKGGPDGMLHTVDWLIAKQRPAHARH